MQIFPLKAQLAALKVALKSSIEANVSMIFLKNIDINMN